MTATRPEDVADLFGLAPPEPQEPDTDAEEAARAEEAALAAELAAAIASGDFAADAPDSRSNLRVEVSWPARMRLPGGRIIDLRVRNVSEGGVGLTSEHDIPGCTVVDFEMSVPALDEGGEPALVKGALKTTYTVARGPQILCGGTWQGAPAGLELVRLWVKRLWG